MSDRKLTNQQQIKADEVAILLVSLRKKLKALEDEYKAQCAPLLEQKRLVDGKAEELLTKLGAENIKTKFGTIWVQVKDYASVKDLEAFHAFVKEHGLEFMENRANVTACREWAKHNGSLPPGVHFNPVRTVIVRQS